MDKNGLQQQEWFATTKINQDLQTLLKNRKDDQDLESLLLDDMPPLIKVRFFLKMDLLITKQFPLCASMKHHLTISI